MNIKNSHMIPDSWNSKIHDYQKILCDLRLLRYIHIYIVYSLRTNTPTRHLIDVLKVFDSSQRDALDQIIGTVTCDNV